MKLHEGLRTDMPNSYQYARIMARAASSFRPCRWRIPEDFLQYSHYLRTLKEIQWTSSPGYPYLLNYTTNRLFFGCDEELNPSPQRLQAIWELVARRLKDRTYDPIRLFIKPEPHKIKKIEKKAYRLISSVSVVDQIIDSMLFLPMNEKMIATYLKQPAKVGWSPYVGGWKVMPFNTGVALDKSAWDWTVQAWMAQMVLDLRTSLCDTHGGNFGAWLDLAKFRYRCLFQKSQFVSSQGMIFNQKWDGVLKSGCVNTITDNSLMQVLLHYRVCEDIGEEPAVIYSMGDDTLQEEQQDMDKYLEKLNEFCIVKETIKRVEFAGHRFRGCSAEPLYRGKHAYMFLHMNPDLMDELAISYSLLYHRSRAGLFVKNMFRDMGHPPPSDRFLDLVFDEE